MFELSSNDLLHLKGHGQPFAEFVDRLIRAEAFNSGVTQDNVRDQLRSHIKDGGVDTEVRCAIPSSTGWFSTPTFWQYKSVGIDEIDDVVKKTNPNDLQAEIRKDSKKYARKLICDGYAMRFCILGDVTPQKVTAWEAQLLDEVRKVDPNAQPPRVVHGGDLRAWAETIPAIVRYLGRTPFPAPCRDWGAWAEERRSLTKQYIANPAWSGIEHAVREHINFTKQVREPVMLIGGEAGVGKSRLVFEAMDKCQGVSSLSVVTMDGHAAQSMATIVVNDKRKRAVLVADECTESDRLLLVEIARAATGRLRIIAISNAANRNSSATGQHWMKQEDLSNTDEILKANKPEVPAAARHNYAALSKGFVRLAIDLCDNHSRIASGGLAGALNSIESYVSNRVAGDAREVASVIAMFSRVGFAEDTADDLATLVGFTQISEQNFKRHVSAIRETPGFVVQAGRYWYVTPEIVARILFAIGWKRWVEPDIRLFLHGLNEDLFKAFQEQTRKLAGKKEGEQLAIFFRNWICQLTLSSFEDPLNAQVLETLVEANPEQHLPLLTGLIVNSSDDELAVLDSCSHQGSTPRRRIVWMLERLVVFADFFDDCEACLFRLARFESEEGIGNNATGVWKSLFSIYLSGTEASFEDRFRRLESYLVSDEESVIKLAYAALYDGTGKNIGRPLPPAAIAGRLRPQDWRPKDAKEALECHQRIFSAVQAQLGMSPLHRSNALRYVCRKLLYYCQIGLADTVIEFASIADLTPEERVLFLHAAESCQDFLHRSPPGADSEWEKINSWVESLRPSDFSGRLRDICSREFWDSRFTDSSSAGAGELMTLAIEILKNQSLLSNELDWLDSPEALSAERLGAALGKEDVGFLFSDLLFRRAAEGWNVSLLSGYIRGITNREQELPVTVLELMTELEKRQPRIAAQLLPVAGEKFDALERMIRLIEDQSVPATILRPLTSFYGDRLLTIEEVKTVLPYLVAKNAPDAISVAIEFAWIKSVHLRKGQQHLFEDSVVRSLVFDALERGIDSIEPQNAYSWCEVTKELAEYDAPRATAILAGVLLGEVRRGHHEASDALQELAPKYSDAVMQAFGEALRDREYGWKMQVSEYRDIVDQLSDESVIRWVEEYGEEGAKLIARHLSPPYINDQDEPVVPEKLNFVLSRFPTPDVLNAFCAGAMSGHVWCGYAADQFRNEACDARRFLRSDSFGIREWAKREIASKESMAVREDREFAERAVD